MTLKKAIERMERHYILHLNVPLADLNKAAEIVIEAAKGLDKLRKVLEPYVTVPLPGETED